VVKTRNDGLLHYSSSLDAELRSSISMLEADTQQVVDNVALSKIEPLR